MGFTDVSALVNDTIDIIDEALGSLNESGITLNASSLASTELTLSSHGIRGALFMSHEFPKHNGFTMNYAVSSVLESSVKAAYKHSRPQIEYPVQTLHQATAEPKEVALGWGTFIWDNVASCNFDSMLFLFS